MEWLKREAQTQAIEIMEQKDVCKPDMHETSKTKYAAYTAKMYKVGTLKQKKMPKKRNDRTDKIRKQSNLTGVPFFSCT